MSRETDSSSSGPQGRGAAAYPSGTPPYGTSAQGAASGDADPLGQVPPAEPGTPDTPRTETTLTTRIRINIPGSRPIPPVVMRTPMSDVDGGPRDGADAPPGPAEPDTAAGRPSALAGYTTGSAETGSAPGAGSAPAAGPGEAPREEKTSDWFAPRKGAGKPGTGAGANGAGAAASGPAANGTAPSGTSGGFDANGTAPSGTSGGFDATRTAPPGTSGGFDATGALATGPLGGPAPSGPGDRDGLPYFSGGPGGPGAPDPGASRGGPSGPTTGPATGDGPMVTPLVPDPAVRPAQGGQQPPRMSDDTAILTPQKPAPEPPGGHVSGSTLTSGIPVVPPGDKGAGSPFAPAATAPSPHTPPKLPDPVAAAPAPAKKKKGRSKLVLLGAGVVGVAGVAYGAGLLMNHSDVPKGTTVLGVDIGGGTRDEAAAKLDAALGKRTGQALKLQVDGRTVALKPDQAGLSLDSAATVSAAAGSDYNPVSVIGSLFGNQRVVDPVMPVDEEKLHAALEQAAGGAAASGDGTIKFVQGKAVAVYGKPGKGIDVDKSTAAVEQAYQAQVETGASTPVPVATTTRQPTISDAEVDRKMQQFAEPAMSGLVTIKAGAASIQFGPDRSLPKILGMKAVDGKLVETFDLPALKSLYGNVFDGVLITRGNGKQTPVQPTDVASAMGKALLGKTPAERTATIGTDAG
ncbi:peptidoglycan binding domain-containing protein [Streptomyces sp. NPDC049813]|uniref:peptidoglycan binding domain-containing protein n=1 Tax=Streptomyces sp. NPDC049813 TaxID=3365597 RepID=UPI0037B91F46